MNVERIYKLMGGVRLNTINGEEFVKKLFYNIKTMSKMNLQKYAEEPHNYVLSGAEQLSGLHARRKTISEVIADLRTDVEFAREEYTLILKELMRTTSPVKEAINFDEDIEHFDSPGPQSTRDILIANKDECMARRKELSVKISNLNSQLEVVENERNRFQKLVDAESAKLREEVHFLFNLILDHTENGLLDPDYASSLHFEKLQWDQFELWKGRYDLESFIGWIKKNSQKQGDFVIYHKLMAILRAAPVAGVTLSKFCEEYYKLVMEVEDLLENSAHLNNLVVIHFHAQFTKNFNKNDMFQPLLQQWGRLQGEAEKLTFPKSIPEYMTVINNFLRSFNEGRTAGKAGHIVLTCKEGRQEILAPHVMAKKEELLSEYVKWCGFCRRKGHEINQCRKIDPEARRIFDIAVKEARDKETTRASTVTDRKEGRSNALTVIKPPLPDKPSTKKKATTKASKNTNGNDMVFGPTIEEVKDTDTGFVSSTRSSLYFVDSDDSDDEFRTSYNHSSFVKHPQIRENRRCYYIDDTDQPDRDEYSKLASLRANQWHPIKELEFDYEDTIDNASHANVILHMDLLLDRMMINKFDSVPLNLSVHEYIKHLINECEDGYPVKYHLEKLAKDIEALFDRQFNFQELFPGIVYPPPPELESVEYVSESESEDELFIVHKDKCKFSRDSNGELVVDINECDLKPFKRPNFTDPPPDDVECDKKLKKTPISDFL